MSLWSEFCKHGGPALYDATGQMTQPPEDIPQKLQHEPASSLLQEADATIDTEAERRAFARQARRRTLVVLALARIYASAVVARAGLWALSDDDYARVTIAQRFAQHAQLDPSGTSWLPFPFWVVGAAMKILDPSLEVARLVTTMLAIASTWLLFAAGRIWGLGEKQATVAALAASVVPAAAVLGSMTVPEFPTAALAAFALIAVSSPAVTVTVARWRVAPVWLAGGAMLAATLSRYEAWPVAAVVSVLAWRRARGEQPRWKRWMSAVVPMLGPLLWIAHNRVVHGDALAFLHRVASYRNALRASGADGGERGWGYLMGLVGGCPALALALAVLVASWLRKDRAAGRAYLARFAPWAAGAAALVVFLVAGELIGGAPTHHRERTLLLVWLLTTFVCVDLVAARPTPKWLAVPVLVLLALDYRQMLAEPGVRRTSEELTGAHLRALVPRGQRVYVATPDYGYFAVEAAFGRPWDVILDRTNDPRDAHASTLLDDRWNSPARLKAEYATWLVAPSSVVFPIALRELSRAGELAIYELDPKR